MKLLTREQARELDEIAINKMEIPGIDLMGRAGTAVADYARNMVAAINNPKIAIICGKGNNAGDGYKAALELFNAGVNPEIFMIFDEDKVAGDSKHYFDLCKDKKIPISEVNDLPTEKYDLIIDAILGTGFKGELKDPILKATNWINEKNGLVLAVDIPTGVNANNGQIDKSAVMADVTVTMGYVKVGVAMQPAKSICGDVVVIDIGFPDIYNKLNGKKFRTSNENLADKYLTAPNKGTYKHRQGKVLILAGSRGMTGAAILASNAAIRSGAGLVTTFAPSSISSIYEINIIEGLTAVCDDSSKGYFLENNFDEIEQYFDWADVLLIGPGLGTNQTTLKLVQEIVTTFDKPILIDADGLNLFIDNLKLFDKIKSDFVITPHFGEFARLLQNDISEIKNDIIQKLDEFSKNFRGVLVAKNAPTIILNNNDVVVNTTGNQGMATGGTGDVLSGIVTSLIAQGIPVSAASELGVFIHGAAADLAQKDKGYRGLIATDIIDYLPLIIKEYE